MEAKILKIPFKLYEGDKLSKEDVLVILTQNMLANSSMPKIKYSHRGTTVTEYHGLKSDFDVKNLLIKFEYHGNTEKKSLGNRLAYRYAEFKVDIKEEGGFYIVTVSAPAEIMEYNKRGFSFGAPEQLGTIEEVKSDLAKMFNGLKKEAYCPTFKLSSYVQLKESPYEFKKRFGRNNPLGSYYSIKTKKSGWLFVYSFDNIPPELLYNCSLAGQKGIRIQNGTVTSNVHFKMKSYMAGTRVDYTIDIPYKVNLDGTIEGTEVIKDMREKVNSRIKGEN